MAAKQYLIEYPIFNQHQVLNNADVYAPIILWNHDHQE